MDVVTAFLIPDLKEEIYMEQPEGFGMKGRIALQIAEGALCSKAVTRFRTSAQSGIQVSGFPAKLL